MFCFPMHMKKRIKLKLTLPSSHGIRTLMESWHHSVTHAHVLKHSNAQLLKRPPLLSIHSTLPRCHAPTTT